MLKKSLLASIALVSVNPIQASQATTQPHAPTHHAHNNDYNNDHNNEKAPSHCPPCPCGGVTGWVLIPAGPGAPCNQHAGKHDEEAEAKPSGEPAPDTAASHHHKPGAKSLHPLPTAEQEKLAADLKAVPPHIYLRANPHSPDPTKKEGEWGKELKGKVYFKELGNWVHDPSVKTTDIVTTGVKARIRAMDAAKGRPQSPQRPTPAIAERPAEEPAAQEAPAERPAPPSRAGRVPPPPPPPPSNKGSASSLKTSSNKSGYQGQHHEVKLPARLIPTAPNMTSNLGSQGDQVYPSLVPGASGTPEEQVNPVNRQ